MEIYIPRCFKSPDSSFFLFGPRGTGKSTYLKHCCGDALWIDLLRPDVLRRYTARPEDIIDLVRGNPEKRQVVVDEVQKAPEILSAVHSLIEEKKDLRFILTGSSARKLKRTGVDLLAGRVLLCTLHPFILSELTIKKDFEDVLNFGLLPIVILSKKPKSVLETYVSLYIQEEVKAEGLVRNIGNFSRFLEAISFSHASVLNISNIARECEVERKVVEGYVSILEDILLGYRIPVFTRKAKRRLIAHPKFYFFDAGVFQTLRPKGPLDRPFDIAGAALEGLVAQHIMAWRSYSEEKYDVFFWRTPKGVEVDFVLYGKDGIYAIEVKNSRRIRDDDLWPLKAFRQDYPQSKAIFLYRGNERLLKDGILCVSCEEYLRNLKPDAKPL